jgi:hypothetical protein
MKGRKWPQRLGKWNQYHPEWKYRDVNSMRAVYYRAIAKTRPKRKKGGKVT